MTNTHEIATSPAIHDIRSTVSGRDYRLFVSVPNAPKPEGGFPVVYLIDGNLHFGATVDTARLQGAWPDTETPVIVGIGYPTTKTSEALEVRNIDLTTPPDPEWAVADWRKDFGLPPHGYGKMEDYLRTIARDIRPLIEKTYPINPEDQTLMGHSLGGLTTLTALTLDEHRQFQHFVAISPSIWWDDFWLLDQLDELKEKIAAGKFDARVLITVGEYESGEVMVPSFPKNKPMPTTEENFFAMIKGCRMVSAAQTFADVLKSVNRDGFHSDFFVHPGEDHRTVAGTGVVRGITFAMYRP